MKLKKGFIQIYTGNGKGKTTAALGQALRAAGNGLKTCLIQFMKDYPYGELKALKKFPDLIHIERYGDDRFVFKKEAPHKSVIDNIKKGMSSARQAMLSNQYQLIILDEICVSIYFGLITTEQVLDLINQKPEHIELILTGRYCPEVLIERADLVTEMKEIKHYYNKGIIARRGIES